MRLDFPKGRYVAELVTSKAGLRACQALRHQCFFGGAGVDSDRYDPLWQHLLVRSQDGTGVCTMRFHIAPPDAHAAGYAAQFYDLRSVGPIVGPWMELGRFCTHPAHVDPHILRCAWAALTQIVDAAGVALIFGCSSFAGTDPAPHRAAFATLHAHHSLPVRVRRPSVALARDAGARVPQAPMPALLRTYLAMGGRVSDRAVIDPDMQTLHVLTLLETAMVPPARARALRALV